MKKDHPVYIIILLILIGCQSENTNSSGFITVDVTKSYPEKKLILQDFLDVEYIPLETNEDFVTVGYVQAIGKDMIIVRNTNQVGAGNIFIFDRSGKARTKINRRGQSNEEYTRIIGKIVLDEENSEMFVNDLRKIMVYDLFGNYKRSFIPGAEENRRIGWNSEVLLDPIYNFDRNHLICYDNSSGRNYAGGGAGLPLHVDTASRNIFFIVSKLDGRVVKEIEIPFEKKILQILFSENERASVSNPGLIPCQHSWLLVEPSSDTIYSYLPDHYRKPFIVRTPSIQSMDPEVFLYPGVITTQYYFLQTIKKEIDEKDPYRRLMKADLVYDREKKKTFEYIVYNDDFTTKRAINNLVDAILEVTVVNDSEIAFMEKIEAFELVEAYKKDELKGKLKEIAAGLDEESNPVIMVAKHKK